MIHFDRNAVVEVRSRNSRGQPLQAKVILDLGEATILVNATDDPAKMQRVLRGRVSIPRPPAATPPPPLCCAETVHGLCALQRQANAPDAREMAEGQWTICGVWVSSRSKPQRGEPTCPDCRRGLRLPLLAAD